MVCFALKIFLDWHSCFCSVIPDGRGQEYLNLLLKDSLQSVYQAWELSWD